MILIGMFDSPFVRRVAITLDLLGIPFEHRNWSVGKDAEQIRQYNPLGRVPTLVLDDGEVLVESASILDYLDEMAGDKALTPHSGGQRRHALKLMSIATGAADKGVSQVYEHVFRPEAKRHQPWLDRCRAQMEGGLQELNEACAVLTPGGWLMGDRMLQPDITIACCYTLLVEAVGFDAARFPALAAHVARCQALPVFKKYHVPFFAPNRG